MKRLWSFVSAMMFAALCCTYDVSADAAQPSDSRTPAVTQTVSIANEEPQELYGLAVDTSAFSLTIGENRALKVSLNTDYYLADSLHFYSDDESVAWVYPYFGGHVIGISAGTATIQVSAKLDKNKVTLPPDDYGYRSVKVKVTVAEPALSETQKAALKKLEEAEQYGRYIYLRERAVITGVLAADAPRLTLDELNRIVDPSQPYEKVWKALMDAQVYPDCYDMGDPTQLAYWLDDRGLETVGIMDCAMIHYSRADENGVPQEVRYLYPEPQGPFVPADVPVRDAYTPYNAPYSPETRPELYGLTLDLPADTLCAGEVRQILASWDGDCYLEHPVIQSDNNDIALVYDDGHLFAQKAGTTTVWVRAKLDPEKVTLAEGDDGIRTVTKTITVTVTDSSNLSSVQKTLLTALEEREGYNGDTFPRIIAEIRGVLDADAPRLTLDEVCQIIEESDSFEEIFRKITTAQPYPDYYGGSGYTSVLYCLNGEGTERIRIALDAGRPAHSIEYERLDQNGIRVEVRELYPESRVHEVVNPNPGGKDWFYSVLHEIADCIPVLGDANCDGRTDVSDAVLIARFAVADQEAVITDRGKLNADVTGDGNITADDSSRILLYIAKKISYEELGG